MSGGEQLAGRDDPLGRLRAALADARAGRGGLVLVSGEPGIGKSALLRALAADAAERAMTSSWGQCWEDSMAPPFWPWTQILRELGHGPEPWPARDASARAGGTDRFAVFEAVSTYLVAAAEPNGLLVVLDDLQWADEATLSLSWFLSRRLPRSRVLVVGAFRDVAMSAPLARLAAGAEVMALGGLADDVAADLAVSVSGGRLPAGQVADVVRRAGGNPLFVRELSRLMAGGSLAHRDDAPLPGGVREVVAQRLALVSPACRAMLDVAAVAGADVRLEVVARALGRRDELPDLVTEAVTARILLRPAIDLAPLAFAHDLYREVLIALLPPVSRARLHLTVARALVDLRADGLPIAHAAHAALAAHFAGAAALGHQPAALEAVRYGRRAADDAARQLAFDDAAGHLRRALAAVQLVDAPVAPVRLDLLLALGAALDRAGDVAAAREAFVEAADLARGLGDADGLAHAAVGTHRLGELSGLSRDQNVRLLEEASGGVADRPSSLRARVLASLARELHHSWEPGTDARARLVAVEAVEVARALDDPSTMAYCLLALHDTAWSVGSAGDRLPIVGEMLDLARVAGERELETQAQLLRATALLELGDPTALAELERYCRAADDLGHARGRWGALSRRAVRALLAGHFDAAASLGDAAARLGEEIGEPDTPGVRDTLRWELARFRDGWSAFETEGHWVPSGTWPPLRAVLLAARGRRDEARSALAGYTLEQDRSHGVRRHDGWMAMIVTEAVVEVGDESQRAAAYDWLRPFAGHHLVYGGCMGYGGAVDHHLARLATCLGRHDDADVHRRAALTMHERLGAVAWAALDRSLLRAERTAAAPAAPTPDRSNLLQRDGDVWRVTFRGRTSTVRHVKGMTDLAVLLRRPGHDVPAIELMGGVDVGGAPGPVLDDQARRAYQARVHDLQVEIDDANAANDWVRAERAEAELDALVEQLRQAFGLGGRQRRSGGAGERARAAVTHRIRGAIRRIAALDPALGQHLLNAVRTGAWCSYRPDIDVDWRVDGDGI